MILALLFEVMNTPDSSQMAEAEPSDKKLRKFSRLKLIVLIVIVLVAVLGLILILTPTVCGPSNKGRLQTDLSAIYVAAQLYIFEHPGTCPTIELLKTRNFLKLERSTTDPWGHKLRLRWANGEPVPFSAGPDDVEGNEDDVICAPTSNHR
jgi:hypothetical protein